MKRAFEKNGYINVVINGDSFKKSLEIIKSIPKQDRKYLPSSKEWLITLNKRYILFLRKHNFDIDKSLFYYIAPEIEKNWKEITLPSQFDFLRDYQKECVQYIDYHDGRALLSLDIGLGKTITSLSYLNWSNSYPVVIVCPAAVKEHWRNEYNKWIKKNHSIKILFGIDSLDYQNVNVDILIVNYELLSRHMIRSLEKEKGEFQPDLQFQNFKRYNFQMVIFDESHRLQNEKSKLFEAARYLCMGVPKILALTGTPIINRPAELFNTLTIIRPALFSNRHAYLHRYCDPKLVIIGKNPGGSFKKAWQFKGSSNEAELSHILSKEIMIRFLKTEVKNSLPEKIPIVYPVKLDGIDEYKILENEIRQQITDGNKTKVLTRFEELKQKAFQLKTDQMFEFIDEVLCKTKKVVIFAWNKMALDVLQEKYKKISVRVSGITKSKDKFENVEKFVTNPKIRLFLGNYRSAGEGIDRLQRVCHTCIFVQLPWHDAMINQCTGRVWREGQNHGVTEYFFIAENTIEEEIIKIIDSKKKMASSVVDGQNVTENNLLESLLNNWKAKYKKGPQGGSNKINNSSTGANNQLCFKTTR